MGKSHLQPFSNFGAALRKLREQQNETPLEVSGAVEIDEAKLNDFESGKTRPGMDVLMLLIQHFNLREEQAQEMWRLAGYQEGVIDESQFFMNDDYGKARQTADSNANDDQKIVYTDMIQVMINNYGVVMNFMQSSGPSNQPLAVSRIGMSKEHARSVIEVLKKTLEQADKINQKGPLQLPDGSQSNR